MEAPFDRGNVDRASLDATERLRTRLSGRPAPATARPGRSILPWVIAGGLFVFSAGMVANPWFEATVRSQLPFAEAILPTAAVPPAEVAALQARLARIEAGGAPAGPAAAPMPSERLARTEARIETSTDQIAREADRIDRLTAAVAGLSARLDGERSRSDAATAAATAAADRAQAMLTLVLARRAVETGRPFGALDAALRRNFEPRYPDAVKAVTALGAAPVTLTVLRRDFDALRPAIGAAPAAGTKRTWWATLTATIAATITPAGAATLAPPDAAAAALARGDALAAANHLRALRAPRPAGVSAWLAAVTRWQAGQSGLATLETATLLAPAAAEPRPPTSGLSPEVLQPGGAALPPNSALPTRTTEAPSSTAVS